MFLNKFKKPSYNYNILCRFLRFFSKLCGVDLFDDNYRMNWRTYTLLVGVAFYFTFVGMTINKIYKTDWTIILRATVTLGTAVQGIFKLVCLISKHSTIAYLHRLIHRQYNEYEKMGDKYIKALNASAEQTKQGCIYLTILYGFGYVGMIAVPYISYMLTGGRFLIIEFHLPGLDIMTNFGYFATLIFQTILIFCFAIGLFCGDLGALLFLTQSFTFSSLFEAKVQYLNEMVENPENNKKPCVTKALKEIVERHQLFSDFTSKCNDLFYYIVTVQITTSFSSTVLCTYLIIAGGWPSAYSYIVVALSSLYLYCIMGTRNEIANEEFEHHIYDIYWYNLTVPQQKIVLQMLVKAQTPVTIDVAGIMPLSVSTALQLTKTIYSIAMFMIKFFLEEK